MLRSSNVVVGKLVNVEGNAIGIERRRDKLGSRKSDDEIAKSISSTYQVKDRTFNCWSNPGANTKNLQSRHLAFQLLKLMSSA